MSTLIKTKGLIVAPLTPMHPDGSVFYERIAEQADLFQRNGLVGVFICGTTGESLSLSIAERKQIAETWMTVINPSLRCIVHVGHNGFDCSKELAQHAESIGAQAIAAFPPVYYKPATLEALTTWFKALAVTTALPIYYYNIPTMTGVNYSMRDFLEMLDDLDNLAGIKFTHEDLFDFGRCLDFQPGKYDILFGRDEILLSALALGAQGAVGGLYNFAAPLFYGVIDAFNNGELRTAQALQQKARELANIYFKYGRSIATAKAMMKIAGLDCGPARLPIKEVTEQQYAHMKTELESVGFLDYCMA
jgi:N-acetylneuraminate lyase